MFLTPTSVVGIENNCVLFHLNIYLKHHFNIYQPKHHISRIKLVVVIHFFFINISSQIYLKLVVVVHIALRHEDDLPGTLPLHHPHEGLVDFI